MEVEEVMQQEQHVKEAALPAAKVTAAADEAGGAGTRSRGIPQSLKPKGAATAAAGAQGK